MAPMQQKTPIRQDFNHVGQWYMAFNMATAGDGLLISLLKTHAGQQFPG